MGFVRPEETARFLKITGTQTLGDLLIQLAGIVEDRRRRFISLIAALTGSRSIIIEQLLRENKPTQMVNSNRFIGCYKNERVAVNQR